MLKVIDLTIIPKENSQPIVDGVSFEVKPRKIHALMGPNGSGKSSIAYSIMGISQYRPTKGKIIFCQEDITHLSITERARRGITLAWQEPARFEGISVYDYIKAGLREKNGDTVKKALKLVGLTPEEYLDRKVDGSLSGGERKRIEIAAAIVMKPRLLILDEPDSGLDIIVYSELYEILEAIKNETHSSILLITHREEAGEIADEGTLIWQGKVKAQGSFKEIMEKYCTLAGRKVKCQKISCPTKF